ncbi:hypothetical protein FQN57_000859 [Myotisia sp. PD_48]|nr:hypothetical protein FQN57_000859 [Myotisia sp. PD_48]
MRDLRRRALESNKTLSRKAQSRGVSHPGSRTPSAHSSPQPSRTASRNVSRHPSDDEETDNLSDDAAWSNTSVDELLAEDDEPDSEAHRAGLKDVVEELIDRKRSSVQGRESYLFALVRILTAHYKQDELYPSLNELLKSLAKSIKTESSERETILALRATSLVAVTMIDDTIYPAMGSVIKRAIMDSPSTSVKSAAIRCLSACAVFGGAGEDGIFTEMSFLMEIIESDGHFIGSPDDPDTVTAALQEWGVLATHIDDLEQESEEAISAFAEQLESSETSVQVAAGENIALLYEKSYTPREEDESDDEAEEDDIEHTTDDDDMSTPSDDEEGGIKLVKRYTAYHNTPHIVRQVESLASVSSKYITKKDKRSLHSSFASVLSTVTNPRRGPHYSNAIDRETDQSYGNRKTVRFHRNSYMHVDRWWKRMRLSSMRHILGGGFVNHYIEGNRAIMETLPVRLEVGSSSTFGNSRTKAFGKRAGRVKGADVLASSP